MSDGLESRVLDLQSPPASCDASGSSSGSVSKKNRALCSQHGSDESYSSGSAEKKQHVIVDLDDIDSEPDDDEAGKDIEQEMVQVKIQTE